MERKRSETIGQYGEGHRRPGEMEVRPVVGNGDLNRRRQRENSEGCKPCAQSAFDNGVFGTVGIKVSQSR